LNQRPPGFRLMYNSLWYNNFTRMDRKEIYEKLKRSPANIRFEDICKNAIDFGFKFRGGKGSHRIFTRPGIKEMLNFQDVRGMCKPYQVRQFITVIEKYNLVEG
jgi:hypothetical protein